MAKVEETTKKKRFRLFKRSKNKESTPSPVRKIKLEPTSGGAVSVLTQSSAEENRQKKLQRKQQQQQSAQQITLLPGMDESYNSPLPPVFEDEDTRASSLASNANKQQKAVSGGKSSWLSRTKYFQQMSDWAFETVDQDGSGSVDEKELYSGLLLIHLKIGSYAGPAACKPVDRERVHNIFHKMDIDSSGSLDREEFRQVMMVLCSNILTRVLAQWSLTLLIVPLVAQYILNGVLWFVDWSWETVTDVDGIEAILDAIGEHLLDIKDVVVGFFPASIVSTTDKVWDSIVNVLSKVPESVWETVPLTLISCVLGILVVPYTIFKIDEYFQRVADTKKEEALAQVLF